MAINHKSDLKISRLISMPVLIKGFVLRSAVIGLLSGSVLGGLFGVTYLVFILTGLVSAGLGIGLGLINGLLISAVTGLFFYPLHHGRRYRLTLTVISAFIAWAGVIAVGPWYVSATVMTPSSAVLIGFGSVLASIVAGWAGGLLGQNLADWYNHRLIAEQPSWAAEPATSDTTPLNKPKRYLDDIFLGQQADWVKVALFALLCPRLGNSLLEFLVCGDLSADVVSCLPSPRLYTSVLAGIRVSLPIFLLTVIAIALFQSLYRIYRTR
ncbi:MULTISPECIES: hypothetical protein [Cyanophyceae]|uniref:hypothetical protein n=1 Tax=Cyanophyceae TaxID=3028117 RepID=UPI0016872BA0|nr:MULTISPECIES: hypothetical protein [Cyanophyceae]MBD1914356.1 hypothetical protein [Phormidium sp. FACHB-77]MBD2028660.1 hypothetical protein [Phormidium sp. FACHB-322]MBD2053646.1 hypothetical protein [Leptolyngbya sp. FACHB-60]